MTGGPPHRRCKALAATLGFLGVTALAAAATAQPGGYRMTTIARPADAAAEFPLYPGPAPGDRGTETPESWAQVSAPGGGVDVMTRNVSTPTYSVFLPDSAKATGAAVIIAPGGAFMALSMSSEGWQAARWLADHGVAAFVLKYRLIATPADTQGFEAAIGRVLGAAAQPGADHAPAITDPDAVPDAQAMMRLVRREAVRFHVDPHRIGFLGFSAGAMTALGLTLADEPASRPDFLGLIYPPMNPVNVPADAPQAFIALASDDSLFGRRGFGLAESWRAAGRPVEFHYYEAGEHGFGMRRQGTTSDHWIDEFEWWLQARHLQPGAPGAATYTGQTR